MKFNILKIFALLFILNIKNNFCMQQYQQSINLSEYIVQLDQAIKQLDNNITDYKEEQDIEFKVQQNLYVIIDVNLAVINPDYYHHIIHKRQELLRKYFNRQFAKEENYSIDIQGKKIINFLKQNLIYYYDVWSVIEDSIQEYCLKNNYPMSQASHYIYNKHIFDISVAYFEANTSRQMNNTLLSDKYKSTQQAIQNTINLINSYLIYKKATCTQETQTDPQILEAASSTTDIVTESTQAEIELDNTQEEKQQIIEIKEPINSTETEEITIDAEQPVNCMDTEININIASSNSSPDTEQEILSQTPRKTRLTRQQRNLLKKESKAINKVASESKLQNSQPEIPVKEAKSEYENIIQAIETEKPEIYNDKFIQRIKKLDSNDEQEVALYNLLKLFINKDLKELIYNCIQEAPKKPKFLIEYIKLMADQGLPKENSVKFFEYAKICMLSEFCKQVDDIIEDIKSKTDDIINLLRIAHLEIICKKNIDFLIDLFNKAKSENKLDEFKKAVNETKVFTELSKWINESDLESVIKHEHVFVEFATSTFDIPSISSNGIINTKESEDEKQSYINKNWIKSNIQLLNSLVKKTNSKDTARILTEICIHYGYDHFEKLVISLDDFKKHLDLMDEDLYYYKTAQLLMKKSNIQAKKFAFECYRIYGNKFNDVQTLKSIIQELKNEKNKKIVIEELEYWHRQVLEKETPEFYLDLFNLARILINKKDLGLPVDIKEIVQCLEGNPLKKAKLYYLMLYSNPEYRCFLHPDPEELTELFIELIKTENVQPEKNASHHKNKMITICRSLLEFSKNSSDLKAKKTHKILDIYNNPKSEISDQERKKLEQKIYEHPLLSGYNGWSKRFNAIINAYAEQHPSNDFEDFLRENSFPEFDIQYFNTVSLYYDNEIKAGDVEYTKNRIGETVLHHAAYNLDTCLVKFLVNQHPSLISINNNENESAIFSVLSAFKTSKNVDAFEDTLIEIIKIIHAKDPNIVNQINYYRFNPLAITIINNQFKVFKFLVEECDVIMNLSIENQYKRILDSLINKDRYDFINYLLKKDLLKPRHIEAGLNYSIAYQRLGIFKLLFNKLTPDQKEFRTHAFLEYSVKISNFDFAEFLLENNYISHVNLQPTLIRLLELGNQNRSELICSAVKKDTTPEQRTLLKSQIESLNKIIKCFENKQIKNLPISKKRMVRKNR